MKNDSFWRLSWSGIIVGRLIEWEMDEEEEAIPWLGFPTTLLLLLVLGLELEGYSLTDPFPLTWRAL